MTTGWEAANRDYLVAAVGVARARLISGPAAAGNGDGRPAPAVAGAEAAVERARAKLPAPATLDRVVAGFGLSDFERDVLLLAAAPELVTAAADELEALSGMRRPSFGLALARLPSAHWSALTPAAPLRRWHLLRLADPDSVTRSPLAVDERVLHHLAGAGHTDPWVAALTRPVPAVGELPATLHAVAAQAGQAWARGEVVALHGPQPANARAVAAAAATAAGLDLYELAAADLPAGAAERDRLLRLMERESVLADAAWAVDLVAVRPDEPATGIRALGGLAAPVALLASADQALPDGSATRLDVPRLEPAERRRALAAAVHRAGGQAADVDRVAAVYDLALSEMDAAARDVAGGAPLRAACRARARRAFGGLATVRTPRAAWADLVLPAGAKAQLRALVAEVRHRTTVLDDWGFGRGDRGLGTAALFAGPSGTGKTFAAEVIAAELDFDLVHVDLGQVMSKYIGETEKNLGRLFDAAEDGGVVLLFDEADALFGRRTQVRDSHDRYANVEVGYLLQRMESFRGLAVLTTNARSTVDQAFLRRLRAIVTFPYPGAAARRELWRAAFPERTPVSGVEPADLATVDLPGGGIASAALTAAYLGAEQGVVTLDHVRDAARWELAKTGRTLGGPRRNASEQ
jgi:ATPase family associated with various cellular activities (AAA)